MKDLLQVQLEHEAEMHGAGILRFEKNNQRNLDSGNASDADWYRRLTREFVRPMADAIDAYKSYYEGRRGKPSACLSHLRCLSSEKAAYIAMKVIFNSLHGDKIPAQVLANNIGRSIEDEVRFTKLEDVAPAYISAIKDSLKKRSSKSQKFEHDSMVHAEKEVVLFSHFCKLLDNGYTSEKVKELLGINKEKFEHLAKKREKAKEVSTNDEYVVDFDRWVAWPVNDVLQLGAKMIDIFANNILLEGQPIIEKVNISSGKGKAKNTPAAIVPTEATEKWIDGYKEVMGNMAPAFEPCVVKPRDWTSPFNGGYHSKEVSSKLHIAKVKNKQHLKRLTQKQMPKVYKALNALQSVKWQIHPSVLDAANQILLRGLPLGMPSTNKPNKPVCPVPAIYADLRGEELMAMLDEEQKEAFFQWKRDTVAYYTNEQKRKADVREAKATLDQANKFSKFEELFFVYTLDFRGRVYAQGSLVSPQGGDLQKALIRFAEAKPLGATGEYWFKVQGANVWGWDKETFAERVSRCETEEFTEMCLDIAADPITFTDWTKADKPWQFLAWCYEYAAYLEWLEDGKDGKDFPSHVAVAMDGSCSGIQHYSAMLRDSVGGKEVNLLPSDKPQDIYGAVSNLVVEWMEAIIDSKEFDCPIWDKLEEKYGPVSCYKFAEEWLRLGVNRSMTKRSVMTLPYGSSQLTCRDSIDDYLKDLQSKADKKALASGQAVGTIHRFDKDLPMKDAISFASMLVWRAIGEVVVAAREGMAYIKAMSNAVSSLNKPMEWVTPTGFIVLQEVFTVTDDKQVFTSMMGNCKFRIKEETTTIDKTRMASSSAPNFVHSMDASHLLLSVLAFADNGIDSIAVIHDSFGTHACDTEKLRGLLSGAFVKMYEENDVILQFKEHNEDVLLTVFEVDLPTKGNLDLQEVLVSSYCFA